ncbi:phosphoglycerate kinase [Candidatus Pacearchaeota archaeon]|nr:phosphoglycerate kinase [Candidatus Pacearchaeota archaeon]
MKTLNDFNFKNTHVLLRTDLNSTIISGKVQDSERIKEAAITINELKRKKAKIIILAHQGQPGENDFTSLRQHAKLLNKYAKVKFVQDIIGKRAKKAIQELKSGEALLLDNIRFVKDEFRPAKESNKLIATLAPLANIYVNDAFSVCHRNQVSLVSFPKYLPSCIGRLLEKELNALKKINLKSKNTLYILGGAKPEDNIKLLNKAKNNVLVTGTFAPLCIIASGKNLGLQNKIMKDKLYLVKKIKPELNKIIIPVDLAINVNNKRVNVKINNFPSNYKILDIGDKTIELYSNKIKKARALCMKGPAGNYSKKPFAKGTIALLRAIANSRALSLIGGGHLNDAISKYKINKKRFGYISLSGGALLSYIAGEKLPGLVALGIK